MLRHRWWVSMNNQAVFEILRAEVAQTQEEYAQSKQRFWRICAEAPSESSHPAGRQRLDLAARAQSTAMIAYTNALHRFNEFLLNGTVPDGLLPKSGGVPQTTRSSQKQRGVHRCVFCGAETRMFVSDHPICMDCANRLDAGEKLTEEEPASDEDSIEKKVKSAGS